MIAHTPWGGSAYNPLCSFCKKVRTDQGYWEQVDVYIDKHSQADISHSICPESMEKFYPEIKDDD